MSKTTGTLHEDVFTFITISRLILLTVKNVSDTSRRKNLNTFFTFSNFSFRKSCIYDIMCKNTVQPDRTQMTIKYGARVLHAG